MRLRDWPLRRKALALLLAATALPLVITGALEFRMARDQMRTMAIERLQARAGELAGEVDDFNASLLRSASQLALLPRVADYCLAPPAGRSAMAEIPQLLASLQASDARLRGVALFDD